MTSLKTLCIVWFDFPNNIMHRFGLILMITLCIVWFISVITLCIIWFDFPDNIMDRLV